MIDPAPLKWVSSHNGDIPSVVVEASDRKQVNMSKVLVETLEAIGEARGQKVAALMSEAVFIFLAVTTRKWEDALLKADAYHDLQQLALKARIDVSRLIACASEALALTGRSYVDKCTLFEELLASCPSGQPLSEHLATLLELGLSVQRTDSAKG